MPYIRYKGRMYNVTNSTYIDTDTRLYSLYYYSGDEFDNTDGVTNRNDIDWNAYGEGDVATNIGTVFEYEAKRFYYVSGGTTWPVLRMYSSNINESYIEWNHANPQSLRVYYDGFTLEIPFIWTDNIDIVDSVPRYNITRARVFVTSNNVDGILYPTTCFGSFNPNDTTGGWFTRVVNSTITITVSNTDYIKTDPDTYLGTVFFSNSSIEFVKNSYGNTIFIWRTLISGSTHYTSPLAIVPSITGNIPMDGWAYTFTNMDESSPGSISLEAYPGVHWLYIGRGRGAYNSYDTPLPQYEISGTSSGSAVAQVLNEAGVIYDTTNKVLYNYLTAIFGTPSIPPSDVDPEDIPPEDEPPAPIPEDDPDPYYDPTSDPTSPTYDPTKDPTSPSYDPSVPATPYQPITRRTVIYPAPIITPPDPVPAPETPSTYVNTSRLFTIFTPTVSQLTDFANFLWASPTDIVPTFRKIVANPMDCVLGLMVIPQLSFTRQSRELNIGNIGTGITMDYAPSQFVDFDCGQLFLQEYYRSYLDYSPYTKVDIFLPFIGTRELSIDECMQKTISVSYRFDLATGICIAFIKINGTVLYQFEGNCASHIPLSAADWGSTVKAVPTIAAGAIQAGGLIGGGPISALGVAAAASVMSMKERHPHAGSMSGSAGLMGVLYPYLIVTRPCQALPESQNSFTGYPSFITLSLSECSGYTEVEQVHLEHVPATGEELIEIERLLKEGVLF